MSSSDRLLSPDVPASGVAGADTAVPTPSPVTAPTGRELAGAWLAKFERALNAADADGVAALFHSNGYWRDLLALHWDMRTFAGSRQIADAWRDSLKRHRVSNIRLEDGNLAVFERVHGAVR